VLNSLNESMFGRLQAVLAEIRNDRSVRAVLLTGAGRGFCAGQDISSGVPEGAYGEHLARHWNPITAGITSLEVPVVAAVNGVAAGAGANLALACDFVVAAEEASFIQAFINIGLVPDTGGTWILPQLVGRARATQLMMLGDRVKARQAWEWGMIHQVCPLAELEATAGSLAAKLAAMPTKALGLTNRLIHASYTNDLGQQLAAEAEAQTIAGYSADHLEGVTAFREKRKPNFTGE